MNSRPRRIRATLVTAGLTVAATLGVASQASAATVSVVGSTASYAATAGHTSNLTVSFSGAAGGTYTFTRQLAPASPDDPADDDTLFAGTGCSGTGVTVTCTGTTNLLIDLGDRQDILVENSLGSGAAAIAMGSGSDTVTTVPKAGLTQVIQDEEQAPPGSDDFDTVVGTDTDRVVVAEPSGGTLWPDSYQDVGEVSYAARTSPVRVFMDQRSGAPNEQDVLESVRRVEGGSGDDLMVGSTRDEDLIGGAGNDRLYGAPGSDILAGGPGNDRLFSDDNDADGVDCGADADTAFHGAADIVSGCETATSRTAPTSMSLNVTNPPPATATGSNVEFTTTFTANVADAVFSCAQGDSILGSGVPELCESPHTWLEIGPDTGSYQFDLTGFYPENGATLDTRQWTTAYTAGNASNPGGGSNPGGMGAGTGGGQTGGGPAGGGGQAGSEPASPGTVSFTAPKKAVKASVKGVLTIAGATCKVRAGCKAAKPKLTFNIDSGKASAAKRYSVVGKLPAAKFGKKVKATFKLTKKQRKALKRAGKRGVKAKVSGLGKTATVRIRA